MPSLVQLLKRRLRDRDLRGLASDLWYFLRDSTPERRRARFGDLDYDFEHDVDTTASNLSTATRLSGAFAGAGYQPTDPEVLRGMLEQLNIDFPRFTFIDLGSGKGRALLLAADYPFRRILGVELLPELHAIAQQNIARYHSESQRCSAIESVCMNALDFDFPADPLVLYLFNPLPEPSLSAVFGRLAVSLRSRAREAHVLYANPILEHLLSTSPHWSRTSGNEQYAIYSFRPQP